MIFACGEKVERPVIEAAELTDKKVIADETDKSEMSDTGHDFCCKGYRQRHEERSSCTDPTDSREAKSRHIMLRMTGYGSK